VSAGEDMRPHRSSSAIASLFSTFKLAFRHDATSLVFVHTFYYNVTGSISRRSDVIGAWPTSACSLAQGWS